MNRPIDTRGASRRALLTSSAALAAGAWLGARVMTAQANATTPEAPERGGPKRVVVAGGALTEIVYALGAQDRVIANDLTSLYPEAATRLPKIGYLRTLSAEGVLSLRPDLLLAGAVKRSATRAPSLGTRRAVATARMLSSTRSAV